MIAYDISTKIDQLDDDIQVKLAEGLDITTQHFPADPRDFALILRDGGDTRCKFPVRTPDDIQLTYSYWKQADLPEVMRKAAGFVIRRRMVDEGMMIPPDIAECKDAETNVFMVHVAEEIPDMVPDYHSAARSLTPDDQLKYFRTLQKLGCDIVELGPGITDDKLTEALYSRTSAWGTKLNTEMPVVLEMRKIAHLVIAGDHDSACDILEALDDFHGRPPETLHPIAVLFPKVAKIDVEEDVEDMRVVALRYLKLFTIGSDGGKVDNALRTFFSPEIARKIRYNPLQAFTTLDKAVRQRLVNTIKILAKNPDWLKEQTAESLNAKTDKLGKTSNQDKPPGPSKHLNWYSDDTAPHVMLAIAIAQDVYERRGL